MKKKDDNICDLLEMVDNALAPMLDYPHGVLYECLCRQKAMLLFELGREEEALAYITESLGVTVRQRYLAPGKNNDAANGNNDDMMKKLLEFGGSLEPDSPLGYKKRLADLPSEWTIVQISQLDSGPSLLSPLSYPKNYSKVKPLVMCRFGCGDYAGEQQVRTIPRHMPLPYSYRSDIVSEFANMKKLFDNGPHFGSVTVFEKLKSELEERYKATMEAVHQWLAEHRCLLLGRIVNPSLAKEVEKIVDTLMKTYQVPENSRESFSLLLQGSEKLSNKEVLEGLENLIPKSSDADRTKFLQTAILYNVTWEMLDVLRNNPASRMPCLALVHAMYSSPKNRRKLKASSTYFVVDPDNNLKYTSQRMKIVLEGRQQWDGTLSKCPTKDVVKQVLQEKDFYLYCGHGTGMHILPPVEQLQMQCASFLVGCCSSDLSRLGSFWEIHGAPVSLMLSGSPAVLGMLVNVINYDADNMTLNLLESWFPSQIENMKEYKKKLQENNMEYKKVTFNEEQRKQLHIALLQARRSMKCSYVAGGFVANGLPMNIAD
ncbi:hypothetical protein B566_EDAN012301 [Ephemera danica]|nr:hypothetical protein B566_EDAN012301 [Ephemera danica]